MEITEALAQFSKARYTVFGVRDSINPPTLEKQVLITSDADVYFFPIEFILYGDNRGVVKITDATNTPLLVTELPPQTTTFRMVPPVRPDVNHGGIDTGVGKVYLRVSVKNLIPSSPLNFYVGIAGFYMFREDYELFEKLYQPVIKEWIKRLAIE